MKGLGNLILLKGLIILAITSFKWLYKRARCYPSGVKMAIFSEKSQKLLSG